MPYTEGTLIFKKTYELIQLIYQYVRLFPKSDKFILGERIESASIDILEGIIKANEKNDKLNDLIDISTRLNILKVYSRLAKDLRLMDLKRYELLSNHLIEVGKMPSNYSCKTHPTRYDSIPPIKASQ